MCFNLLQAKISILIPLISIIICSRTTTISDKQKNNIAATVGFEHEIIAIDNSKNELSIFEAYNIGILKSKGDIFCFMHDDIFFHTQDWGKNVYHHFSNDQVGAIGVAGSPYATKMPGSW
ncbi:MAG: glycosyltransferase, partial [Pedobacter sp.]